MFNILSRLCSICLLTLFIFNNLVKSSENNTETSIDYENENQNQTFSETNHAESGLKSNSTDDYDYGEVIEDNDCEEKQSFIERLKIIHSEGKNYTLKKRVNHINETFELIKNVQTVLQTLFPTDGRAGLEFLEFLSEIDLQLSSQCSSALFRVVSAMRKFDLWALKFYDSAGRFPPPGFAEGIQSSFGEFDECLNIESPKNENNNPIIRGQYCLLNLILPYPSVDSYNEGEPVDKQEFSFADHYNIHKLSSVKSMIEGLNLSNGTIYHFGICVPHVCTADEIEDMINKIVYPIFRFPIEVGPKCHIKNEEKKLDNWETSSISILTALTFLVIISTAFEIYNNRKELEIPEKISKPSTRINDLWLSFSIIKNTKSLFSENTRFAALDTIRLLVIVNVHVTHLYSLTTSAGSIGLKKIFSKVTSMVYEDNEYVFARNPIILEILFTLSGFLLSYGLLRKLEKTRGCFNYFLFIFQKWIRFLILAFASILMSYLLPFFGDGPVWDLGIKLTIYGCKMPSVLMENFFFINNFNSDMHVFNLEKCHPMTWFLASLLQLTIIAPFFIILYFKKPTLGLFAILSAIILGVFASIAPQILFGLKPYLQIWELETVLFSLSKSFTWYHYTPNNYATSFFVGIAFGYLMKKGTSFNRLQENFFWIMSTVMILTVYFWHNSFWRLDRSAPLWSALLWHSVGKLFFSLGFAWIMYACSTGRGGCFNQMLSWHGFQPMARLSFGIYLIHHLVVVHRIFTVKDLYVMNDKLMLEHLFVDILAYDVILAYIFYILIESPFTNIFKVIFSPTKQTQHINNNSHISKL